MGKRGPIGQPNNVRQLRGNPGSRMAKPTPQAVHEAPSPAVLPLARGLAEWKRIVPELKRLQIISQLDRAMLSCYVQAYSTMVAARKEIGSSQVIQGKGRGEPIKSPAWQIFRDSASMMTMFAKELGLTRIHDSR